MLSLSKHENDFFSTLLDLIPQPYPWMPAYAGMTEGDAGGVIPAKAGIQAFAPEEVLG